MVCVCVRVYACARVFWFVEQITLGLNSGAFRFLSNKRYRSCYRKWLLTPVNVRPTLTTASVEAVKVLFESTNLCTVITIAMTSKTTMVAAAKTMVAVSKLEPIGEASTNRKKISNSVRKREDFLV